MKKKITSLVLLFALLFSLLPSGSAASSELDAEFVKEVQTAIPNAGKVTAIKGVKINGTLLTYDEDSMGKPFAALDRTFLPIRAICDALGYQVSWSQGPQLATIADTPKGTITLSGMQDIATITSPTGLQMVPNTTGVPAVIVVNARIYVQVFLLVEILDAKVDWDDQKKLVMITYDGANIGTQRVITGLDTKVKFTEDGLPNLHLFLNDYGAKINISKSKVTVTTENTTGKNAKDRLVASFSEEMYTVNGLNFRNNSVQLLALEFFLKDICEEEIYTEVMHKVDEMCDTLSEGATKTGATTQAAKNWVAANRSVATTIGETQFTWNSDCSGFTLGKQE